MLTPLAPVERDRFGIVAQSDESIAEIRLATALREIHSDQRPADRDGQERSTGYAHHQNDHEHR